MAKPKKRKKKPGYTPPVISADALIEQAVELRASITDESDGAAWGAMQKALLAAKADAKDVARAIMGRDMATLDAILAVLKGEEPEQPPAPEVSDEPLPEFPGEQLRDAMKAFRRRVKLTKLDHESKLGRSPLSTGKDADFDSIMPPREFPEDIWKVLVQRGELEQLGYGFYRIPKAKPEFPGA
jgi:hypothetical protein